MTDHEFLSSLPVDEKIKAIREALQRELEICDRLMAKYRAEEETGRRLLMIGTKDGVEQSLHYLNLYFPTPQTTDK